MLLILSNTPISKHYCLCLNPCLDIPTKSKFYVKNLVTKHNKDLNSKSLIYRKIGPMVKPGWIDRKTLSSVYYSKTFESCNTADINTFLVRKSTFWGF